MRPNKQLCRFSVVSVVLGIVGIFPAAIVCGHIALRRIRRDKLRGKRLAITGLTVGYLLLVLFAAVICLLAMAEPINPIDTPEMVRMLRNDETVSDVFVFDQKFIRIKMKDGTEYNGEYIHENAGEYSTQAQYADIFTLLDGIKKEKNSTWKVWSN